MIPTLRLSATACSNWTSSVRPRLLHRIRDPSSISDEPNVLRARGGDGVVRRSPRESYLRPDRDDVARSAPHLLCPSSILGPGEAYAGLRPDGTSVFAHRCVRDGKTVKAYVNRCRHRGSPLVRPAAAAAAASSSPRPHGSVRLARGGRAVVCPYHAWTYDASSGRLVGVPGKRCGFPEFGQEGTSDGIGSLALAPVECREVAGAVWVGGSELAGAGMWNVAEVSGEIDPLLASLSSAEEDRDDGTKANRSTPLVAYREWDVSADWQLLIETFLEAYHVSSLHRDTLATVAHSNVMVTDTLDSGGRNLRMVVPLKNFPTDEENGERGNDGDDGGIGVDPLLPSDPFFGQTTVNYFIFPNVSIAFFKRFVLQMTISPAVGAVGRSKIRAFAVNHGGSVRENPALQRRDFENFVVGIEEDWRSAEDIQRALNLGRAAPEYGNETFLYGRYEGNNVAFLDNVGEAAAALKSTK